MALKDAEQKPLQAMDVLAQLEKLGETGRAEALFREGVMFGLWGVQEEAAQRFERLAKLGYAGDPRLRLALGRAFAHLGQTARARESGRRCRR